MLPVWQQKVQKYRDMGFTVVGIALDAEGVAPAKLYYERFDVTFPALVDPNYATGFGAVPKTFFVDENGVVQVLRDWEQRLKPPDELRPVTAKIRTQWTQPQKRLDPAALATLAEKHAANVSDLATAVELASRYLDLNLTAEAGRVLKATLSRYDAKQVARAKDAGTARLLGQAYFQLSRASLGDRNAQVRYATLSFYVHPSVGYGKQIARIIAPKKFDGRPKGDFDNRFREGTLRRLKRERREWLGAE